jgi:predicted outer membrane repeat protein
VKHISFDSFFPRELGYNQINSRLKNLFQRRKRNICMKIKNLRFLLLIALVFSLLTPSTFVHAAGVLYAKSVASGTGDCLSWANACTLQTALTGAASGNEIWATAGTYKPTTLGTDRSATFQLKNGVAVYGGFAGEETERTQQDPVTNLTILSGDIDNNDSQTPIITDLTTVTGNTTNSYHVVIGATGAILDGFTITAGNANFNDNLNPDGNGGGMLNDSGSNPTLTNLIFRGNSTSYYGGGMLNWNSSSPILTNVTFNGNSAGSDGGGMFNWNSSSPALTNVTFNGNSALVGGGMYNYISSNSTLSNVTFYGNTATYLGGGGMYNDGSSPTLTNVTFSNNSATTFGGGMYNGAGSNPQIRNTIFWGNTALSGGAQISDVSSTPIVNDSVVQGGYAGTNIITTDPLLGTLGDYGGFTQTIPLLAGSSAIDTGNDDVCPNTDQRGVTRPQGAHCDIGAYEVRVYQIYLPMA